MTTAIQDQPFSSRLNAATVRSSTRLVESGLVPDSILRLGIRRLLAQRLRDETRESVEAQSRHTRRFVEQLKAGPVAISTRQANEQHYEVPPRFFELILGKRLKYSSGFWPEECRTLDQAEEAMLALTAERARLQDGQDILELGCGWGSLTLWMAERFPQSRIVAVSNSAPQRAYITKRLRQIGREDVRIVTADMNDFDASTHLGTGFDRVVSVEMFEHMRNYEILLERIASWMKPDALLFVHIFTHRLFSYPFDARDESDWMSTHFFTGGIMPSNDLLLHFQRDVKLVDQWLHSGVHYEKTARAWLENADLHQREILDLFAATYGANLPAKAQQAEARKWFVRWRIFLMACEELWGYRGGQEWGVTHYLFGRR
jgi:cyclopropane-fatty-acyl-phospholipid synthase